MNSTTHPSAISLSGRLQASLNFAYTPAELDRIRSGELLDRHAEALRQHGKKMLRWYPLIAGAAMLAFCLFLIGRDLLDGYEVDASAWGVAVFAPGFTIMLYIMMLPLVYLQLLRPAKRRKLSVIPDAKAKILRKGPDNTRVQFGSFTRARAWNIPTDQIDRLDNGAAYNVYRAGHMLIYLEPAG